MIKIVDAKESDRLFLAEVCIDAVQLYDIILPGAFEKQAKKLEEEGLPKTYEIQTVSLNDIKIGFIGHVNLDTNILYITALYLLTSYQRKGYGKVILDMIEKDAYQKRFKRIALIVHTKATWAIDFYEKNGFRVIETEENNIKKYANSKMTKYALPSTILMGKEVST